MLQHFAQPIGKSEFYTEVVAIKKKKVVIFAIIIALIVLLTPIRMNLKDGGSVKYQALLYDVTKIHRLSNVGGESPYIDGIVIKLLGMTVYQEITPAS